MKERKPSTGKVVLSTLLFWGILLFGPFVLAVFNALSPVSYEQGSLGFLIFTIIAQGASALIAWYVASYVFDGVCRKATGINCVVGATVLVILAILTARSVQIIISYAIAVVALIVGAVDCLRDRNTKTENEQG